MNFYNPYQPTQYQNQYAYGQQPPMQRYEITRVNGRNGADAFRMAPNSSILLMDENDPVVWLKVTDGAGYATITPYSISPYQPAPAVDVNSLETRVSRLEEMLSGKSDAAAAKPRKNTQPNAE